MCCMAWRGGKIAWLPGGSRRQEWGKQKIDGIPENVKIGVRRRKTGAQYLSEIFWNINQNWMDRAFCSGGVYKAENCRIRRWLDFGPLVSLVPLVRVVPQVPLVPQVRRPLFHSISIRDHPLPALQRLSTHHITIIIIIWCSASWTWWGYDDDIWWYDDVIWCYMMLWWWCYDDDVMMMIYNYLWWYEDDI